MIAVPLTAASAAPSRALLSPSVAIVRGDTIPKPVHPDSVAYTADPSFGRQLLKAPAALLHLATLPVKWSIIFISESEVLPRLSDFFLNEEGTAGFYPNVSIGGRTDFAGGITYFNRNVFDRGHSLDLNSFYTNTENFKLGANYKVPPGRYRRYQVELQGDLRKNSDQDIFLGGNDGDEDMELDYKIERYNLRAEFGYLFHSNFLAQVSSGFKHTIVRGVTDITETGEPVVDFIDVEQFGLGTLNLVNAGIGATYDQRSGGVKTTNESLVSAVTTSYNFKQTKTRVSSGYLLDAGLGYNRSVNNSAYEFLNYYGEGQYYLPIPGLPENRRLALRARLEKRYPLNGGSVPFYENSFLGSPDDLRGYEQDRFRDLGSLLLTFEYRYPIWDTWDAVVFTDQGQVFNSFDEIGLKRFHGSVGTGLRFMTASDFLFRVEIAFSKEETQGLLQFNMNF